MEHNIWTDLQKARAAKRIRDEMERRALTTTKVAALIDKTPKTVERATAENPSAPPSTIVAVAEALSLPLEEVLPPRPPAEQAQLDRIEAMLEELLERVTPLTPGESPAGVGRRAAARIEGLRPEGHEAPKPKQRRGRGV